VSASGRSTHGGDPGPLVAVALGQAPADLVVRGGTLANVYSGELLEGWGVAVVGERIAAVGPEVDRWVGPATAIVEAAGQVIAPGFLDVHTHLDCFQRLDLFLAAAVPTGLTTAVTETSHLSNVGGSRAVEAFLAALPGLPVTVLATAPTISFLVSDRGDGAPMVSAEEMARLLEEPGIVGLGEVYWPALLEGRRDLSLLVAKAESLGKRVEGHTAGARAGKLVASVAAGLTACHEPITPEEIRARLRLGLYTMIRDGSVRRDIEALDGALTGADPRRLILVSDSLWPHHLAERGYLDATARRAAALGLTPMQALQAITLTPAEYFRLDGRVGGLAPGRQADLVLMPRLADFRPSLVMARGRILARAGRMEASVPPVVLPPEVLPAPRLPRSLALEDLRIPAPGGRERVRVRVIEFSGEIVTQAAIRELPVQQGILAPGLREDLVKVVALDRYGGRHIARGFVAGYGLRRGALATSLSFDPANLILLGVSDADMLAAAERLRALGGGFVVVAGGRVEAEVRMPEGGIFSNQPAGPLADAVGQAHRALRALGCQRRDPLLSAQVLTFTAIPALRIRERGLWDVRANHAVSLFVESDEAGGGAP
jgi:adenine deaminase